MLARWPPSYRSRVEQLCAQQPTLFLAYLLEQPLPVMGVPASEVRFVNGLIHRLQGTEEDWVSRVVAAGVGLA